MSTARLIDLNYVKTGQVRIVFRNHAGLGPESIWAAEAALCAGDQGKFWDYHDKLFESWAGENQGAFAKPNLERFATDLGLDAGKFNACLEQDKYAQRVQDETAEGDRRGVKGTPSFFVNDVLIVGAQPYEVFKSTIEAALKR